ncbi:MAG TPA: tetratricopeptide repeat protein [Terriglobales bacterium]|jgi:tetratricopeptide (TPR) repeat protein|nr:tetratricopeptide repeat protein [Terriglobales bacterium]
MKQRFLVPVLLILMAAACSQLAFAQATVRGLCTDVDGKPITGAVVHLADVDTGRKYDLKTNNKGEYFSLGIAAGKYNATLLKDGKELFHVNGVQVGADEVVQDFDLKKALAATGGMTPEQLKAQQAQNEKVAKENLTVKALNEKLSAAKTAADAKDFDTAVKTLTEATQMDPTRDVLWANLGLYTISASDKQTDSASKSKGYEDAASDIQKAIDIKQKTFEADPSKKTPDATKQLATYYNNLGKAAGSNGKTDEAIKAYNQAIQLDPASAAVSYFNLGATLTNANTKGDPQMAKAALDAFDKAIAADPNRADAYYWKGTILISQATLKDDKMVTPPGTAEAFQKYLDLAPTGSHAEEAKSMLAAVGAKVETSYGTKKPKK